VHDMPRHRASTLMPLPELPHPVLYRVACRASDGAPYARKRGIRCWPTDLVVLSGVREDCVRFRLARHIFAFQPDMHRCNLSP
jgi:hypothetical protein